MYLALGCGLAGMLVPVGARAADHVISIDDTITYQQIDGFGASMTDSSAYLIYGTGVLDAAERDAVMRLLFDHDDGIGLSYLRQPMGTSDFRHAVDYSYDDMPPGQTDLALAHFSIAPDMAYIVPALQDALAINPDLKIMGSPWSPPAWMKDTGQRFSGSLIDSDAIYATYAEYFVRYVQAYAALGLPIHAVTLQNEPHWVSWTYPSMWMEPNEQVRLVQHMGPAFVAAGLNTKIIVWDHNWDEPNYPRLVFQDPVAYPYIAGAAFHCYAGAVENQSVVHNFHPGKEVYMTECSGGGWAPGFANGLLWDTAELVIGATRNWAKAVVKWNIALDQDGGPKIDGGCGNCRGVVQIDKYTGAVAKNPEYYSLGHASKFVLPGAWRIDSSEASGAVENVAFRNPAGDFVAVVLNGEDSAQSIEVQWRGQTLAYNLPAESVTTFTWPEGFNPYVSIWVTTADQSYLLRRLPNRGFVGGSPPGDLDGDGDADLSDHAVFANCFAGPQVTTPPAGCPSADFAAADLDDDGDVDAADFAVFQPLLAP